MRQIDDHWTNRQPVGSPPRFEVTGSHLEEPRRKTKAEREHRPSGRGIIQSKLL